jgi:hypothetical protein
MERLMMLLMMPLLLAGWSSGRAASAAAATPATPVIPATATTQPTVEEKCRDLADRWRDRFAAEHVTCIVSPPFVVAGDGGQRRLQGYVDHTILASAAALHRKFFDRAEPSEPILILLFESAESYKRLAKKWLGDQPTTPYGYFRRDNIMVMNVGTGTGTLVHELVHALIRPDFPDTPEWFNEGLGSLFEQCTLAHRDIRGLENWRLPALQRAIRDEKLRSLREMIQDEQFYGDKNVGLNYAQARYLLMYLQEQGKLADYYHKLRAGQAEDKTGVKTLETVIEPKTLGEFEKAWRAWVMQLRLER